LPAPVLKSAGPTVELVRGQARTIVTREITLRARDELHLGDSDSALIRYGREQTQIELEPGTVATFTQTNRTRWIHLIRGTLYATVARQRRGQSLVLVSPQGKATVLGTDLKFSAGNDRTVLEVYSGKVRLASLSTQTAVEVKSGLRGSVGVTQPPELDRLPPAEGRILWEQWTGLPGSKVGDLTNNVRFPSHPDGQAYLNAFELPINWGDRFGSRIRGLLCPRQTGNYTFWLTADDVGELWLSPTELPARKERICYTTVFTAPGEWDKRPEQRSRSFHLIGGRRYYIEALLKEDGGGDCLGVAWEGPRLTRAVISGEYLSPAEAATTPSAR
jgi:hypothetical protein